MQKLPNIKTGSEHRNIAYLLLTEVGTKILSFLAFAVMARSFSPESYGVITLAFSVGSLFFIFFNLGLDYHLIRDIRYFLKTNNRAAFHELASTVATLKVWLLPVFLGIFTLVFLSMQWDRAYFPVMILIFLYFYIVSATQLILFFFRALEKMEYEFAARVTQAILILAATFVFGYFYKNPLALTAGYSTIAIVTFVGIFIFFVRKLEFIPQIHPRMKKREITLIGKTKYLFFIGIATSIFSGVDILIISKMGSIENVAIYKNAVMITLALFMIPTAIVQGFFPKLVQHKVELRIFFQMIKKIFLRLLPLGMAIAAVFFVLGPRLIIWVFGDAYSAAAPLFRISLLAFLFATVNQVLGYGMMAIGKYKSYFFITLTVSITSVFLNIILISKIGLLGGIITLNISHLLLILLPMAYLYILYIRDKKEGNTIAL